LLNAIADYVGAYFRATTLDPERVGSDNQEDLMMYMLYSLDLSALMAFGIILQEDLVQKQQLETLSDEEDRS
jgi:hypothetical protein